MCLVYCKHFEFVALANGTRCICLEHISKIKTLGDSECNIPCGADPENFCGAPYKWNVHQNENIKPFNGECLKEQGRIIAIDNLC